MVVSFIFYGVLRNALIDRALDQLSSINILKKQLVENYLIRSQLNLEALQVENKFQRIFNDLRQSHPEPDHQDIKDIENLCRLYDFKNLHVFDTHHNQLFSTDHEMYPEGLLTKIDSAIATDKRHIHIIDASIHSEEDQTLLFYYVPIVLNEKLEGIVLVQENFQKIQRILLENTGMGNTGESYIVGPDYSLRSASRFFPDSVPGSIIAETEAMKSLIVRKEGQGIIKDYRGVSVLSAYRNIDNSDLRWAILSEMDEHEAMEPIVQLRNYLILITMLIMAMIFVITYFLSNAIVKPVIQLKEVILTLSKGMIPFRRVTSASRDEIGEMAMAIQQLTDGLERTTTFANEIGGGNFDATFTTLSEKDSLGFALLQMRDELREFHDKEMKSARARAAALLEGQEAERTRIIKELHDGVGQMLTAILMQVDMISGDAERKKDIMKYINEAIAEVKRISYHVMPQAIVDFGLEAALKGLCESLKKYSTIAVDFRYVHESDQKLHFDISIAVYRIVQEGLNNIIKHAQAVSVLLHVIDKEDELYCVLEDNGKGFLMSEMPGYTGAGLKNIAERVMLLDGKLEIHSNPGGGTSIEFQIPKNREVLSPDVARTHGGRRSDNRPQ